MIDTTGDEISTVAELPPWKDLGLEERLRWALQPEIPAAYRRELLREQWMQTRCYFARRTDLQAHEVATLAEDGDYVIRLCIAKRPDLNPMQLARFCADRDPNVRYAVARNPHLTSEQRTQLASDEDEVVAQAAQKGPRPTQTRMRPGQAPLYR